MGPIEAITRCAAETRRLGEAIGGCLCGGELIGVVGALGAGKTELIKGIAAGLGVSAEEVVSPTFVLVREYAGRLRLFHLDAYRLRGSNDLWDVGVEEMLANGGAATVIEWIDRAAELMTEARILIEIEHLGPHERRLRIEARGEALRARVAAAIGAGQFG